MTSTANLKTPINTNLIYPELSYKIIGILFSVFNNLKYGYQEKYYQRAIAEELKNHKIPFRRELSMPISYNGKIIGRYFIDFVVDNKIAIELKVGKEFYPRHWAQLAAYLRAYKLPLGVLALITQSGIKYKRIANTKYSR